MCIDFYRYLFLRVFYGMYIWIAMILVGFSIYRRLFLTESLHHVKERGRCFLSCHILIELRVPKVTHKAWRVRILPTRLRVLKWQGATNVINGKSYHGFRRSEQQQQQQPQQQHNNNNNNKQVVVIEWFSFTLSLSLSLSLSRSLSSYIDSFWQVFLFASSVRIELKYVHFSVCPNTGVSLCWNPPENFAFEFVLASPSMPGMFCSSYLEWFMRGEVSGRTAAILWGAASRIENSMQYPF